MEPDRAIGIRDLHPVDAGLASALHAAGFDNDPWPARAFSELLATPGTFGVLAFEGDAPLGLLLCRAAADECEILTITVVEAARRRGVGRLLLANGLARARLLGVRTLFLEVAVDNAPAIGLYRQAGFEQIASRPAYYLRDDPPGRVDATVMSLDLKPHSDVKS